MVCLPLPVTRPNSEDKMLFSIDRNEPITAIPYQKDYTRWRNRLTDAEYQAIERELLNRIDGAEIHTSSWIPGNDWSGTVNRPLLHRHI